MNKKGMVTFARNGTDSRTSQMFVNLADNPQLDKLPGFRPVGQVVEGIQLLPRIYDEHGEYPRQEKIFRRGTLI